MRANSYYLTVKMNEKIVYEHIAYNKINITYSEFIFVFVE